MTTSLKNRQFVVTATRRKHCESGSSWKDSIDDDDAASLQLASKLMTTSAVASNAGSTNTLTTGGTAAAAAATAAAAHIDHDRRSHHSHSLAAAAGPLHRPDIFYSGSVVSIAHQNDDVTSVARQVVRSSACLSVCWLVKAGYYQQSLRCWIQDVVVSMWLYKLIYNSHISLQTYFIEKQMYGKNAKKHQ